ncbi:lipoprotein [Streptomyces lacrimifluminis]|uniref:Lipoprotein n=1 Tax=Streptomyces lacrimifluminis TaxID=1500077 RepID=A0A917NV46_9ACTN|nr:sensor domain-containing protein [Streptomyces lacrimifluminis]GGJ31143.1 lipoprotein [Streptomyces lacrimifluminis]
MRNTVVRRTALTASVAALALLGTACGSSPEPAADAVGGGGDKAGESTTAAKALTAAELGKAALVQADVKSGTLNEKVPAKDDIAQDKVSSADAACAPLAYLQSATYVGKPAAVVKRTWKGDAEKPAAGASDEEQFLAALDLEQAVITLASYEDGGAEQAMKDLDTAVGKCAGGFSYTVTGTKNDTVRVTTTTAPEGADEALALTVSVDTGELKAPMKSVVVRKGATLVYIPTVNFAAASTGKDFPFPTELVDAQLAKLG